MAQALKVEGIGLWHTAKKTLKTQNRGSVKMSETRRAIGKMYGRNVTYKELGRNKTGADKVCEIIRNRYISIPKIMILGIDTSGQI